jgi:hypothetical protein
MVFCYSQNNSYPSYYYQRVEFPPEVLEMKIKKVFIVDDHPVAEMAKALSSHRPNRPAPGDE